MKKEKKFLSFIEPQNNRIDVINLSDHILLCDVKVFGDDILIKKHSNITFDDELKYFVQGSFHNYNKIGLEIFLIKTELSPDDIWGEDAERTLELIYSDSWDTSKYKKEHDMKIAKEIIDKGIESAKKLWNYDKNSYILKNYDLDWYTDRNDIDRNDITTYENYWYTTSWK